MSASGFDVDADALDDGARSVRAAVADGTFESVCVAWGSSYGHDALTAALLQFTTDADQAVDQLAARGEAIAVTLVEQAETYRAIDAGTQQRFGGPGIGPTSPLLPPSPFGGTSPYPALQPSATPSGAGTD